MKVTDLIPDERNANKGTQRGLKALDHSLRQYGAGRSILIDKRGRVIAGNKTVERAADIGLDDVIVVESDGTKLVAVQRTDLDLETDKAARELAWADNRVGQLDLDWEPLQLAADLEAGLDLTGLFDPAELSEILERAGSELLKGKQDPGPQIDKADELRQKWGVELGQLWALGKHKIIIGDCTNRAIVEAVTSGEMAAMIWTDPPYGVQIVGGTHNPYLPSFQSGKRIENDDLSASELERLLRNAFNNIYVCCQDGGAWYVAAPAGPLHLVFGKILNELKIWHQTIQWVKHAFVFGRNDYHYRNEPIFYGWKPGAAHYFIDDRTQDTIWEFDRPGPTDKVHPTVKPVELIERAIKNSSCDNDTVLDPFIGSGTTMIAAQNLGRRCFGIEINPGFAAVSIQRWVDLTGGQPCLIDTVNTGGEA